MRPPGFAPVTQLEFARLGQVTPEMRRVAEREGHLSPEQVRDEVASGRMVIPANRVHRGFRLDPMGIGRASHTKINANMGASPLSSSTQEEVENYYGVPLIVQFSSGTTANPIGKIIKRLEEGDEHNLPYFYRCMCRAAHDPYPPNATFWQRLLGMFRRT